MLPDLKIFCRKLSYISIGNYTVFRPAGNETG